MPLLMTLKFTHGSLHFCFLPEIVGMFSRLGPVDDKLVIMGRPESEINPGSNSSIRKLEMQAEPRP